MASKCHRFCVKKNHFVRFKFFNPFGTKNELDKANLKIKKLWQKVVLNHKLWQ